MILPASLSSEETCVLSQKRCQSQCNYNAEKQCLTNVKPIACPALAIWLLSKNTKGKTP